MLRPTSHALVLLSFCLVAACRTVPNAEYCNDDTDCRTPEHPDWECGPLNSCTAPPGASCDDDGDCTNPAESFCDIPMGVCRGCKDGNECAERDDSAPFCGANGECMAGCEQSSECSAAMPYCNTGSGVCESCQSPRDDALCASRGQTTPYCGPGGACVACLASAQCAEASPVCDTGTNTCGPCKEHSDCGMHSGVCDRGAGECVPADNVIYVVEGGTSTSPCDAASPCGSLDAALALVSQTRRYILLDDKTYPAHLDLEDTEVTIIGNNASILGTRNAPVVAVADNVTLTLEGVEVRNAASSNTAEGIRCLSSGSSTVRLDDVIVRGNGGIGIRTTSCELVLEGSVVQSNVGGGIDISNGAFAIVNSFILGNGSSAGTTPSNLGGVRITNIDPQAPQVFAFNTVAQNQTGTGARASGVDCSVNAVSTVVATSSIVRKDAASKPAVSGTCAWVFSNIQDKANITPPEPVAAPSNNDADCMLTNNTDGLPAIAAESACQNAGQPLAEITIEIDADLEVDYQGTSRLATPPDMGADEL
jgi:hypothetical protein